MFNLILACTNKFGIGHSGGLAWKCSEDLKLFKTITDQSVLIMGRKTVENLPKLAGRTIICLTKTFLANDKNSSYICSTFEEGLEKAKSFNKPIFVCGGGILYDYCFKNYIKSIDKFYLSLFNTEYNCDTFVNFNLNDWVIEKEQKYEQFNHYVLNYDLGGEKIYLNLLTEISKCTLRQTRNGMVASSFGRQLSFDLTKGFPLLTTKKMFFRGIVEELLFFLSGQTNTKLLEQKGVNIWKGNTSTEFLAKSKLNYPEGEMGPLYGWQWRNFNGTYPEGKNGVDQIKQVIHTIKTDPTSRRILLTDYNPCQADQGVLYPCHSIIIQFYVDDKYVDLYCYNRSQDLFLGTPFNIASTALLCHIIASVCNLKPRNMLLGLGDVHIYQQHLDLIVSQTERLRYKFPVLKYEPITNIDELSSSLFSLEGYCSHSAIKAEMIA